MARVLNVLKDINGEPIYSSYGGYDLPEAAYSYGADLVADTETTMTIPDDVNIARFKYTTDTWISQGSSTLTLPGASLASIDAELTPEVFHVNPGNTLRLRSLNGGEVQVIFYKDKL